MREAVLEQEQEQERGWVFERKGEAQQVTLWERS